MRELGGIGDDAVMLIRPGYLNPSETYRKEEIDDLTAKSKY